MEKLQILSHQKIFREINSLATSEVGTLLSRNFCQKCVRVNFLLEFQHSDLINKQARFQINFKVYLNMQVSFDEN